MPDLGGAQVCKTAGLSYHDALKHVPEACWEDPALLHGAPAERGLLPVLARAVAVPVRLVSAPRVSIPHALPCSGCMALCTCHHCIAMG